MLDEDTLREAGALADGSLETPLGEDDADADGKS